MRTLLVVLAPLAAACTNTADHGTGEGGIMPLDVHYTTSGGIRLGAWVQIGNAPPFKALLDTGSSGLRVLPSAVDDSAYAAISDELVSYSYHSGVMLQGALAYGTVTLGGLATPHPIPIMRVREIGCTVDDPDCDAAGQSVDDYKPFGYSAVLGIGMRNSDTSGGIGNPIAQLAGAPGYVVRAPAYGDEDGEVDIGASLAQLGGTTSVQLPTYVGGAPLEDGTPAWDDRTVPTCVSNETSGVPFCAGGLFDTGSTTTELEWPSYAGAPTTWTSGTEVAVAVGEAAAPIASYAFTVGTTPVPGIDKVVSETRLDTTEDLINLGIAPFLRYDVWFDQAHGIIGTGEHTL